METITIPVSEYRQLVEMKNIFETITKDEILKNKLQTVYQFVFQSNNNQLSETQTDFLNEKGISKATSTDSYTSLFGLWSDMTETTEEYRQKLWQRTNIF